MFWMGKLLQQECVVRGVYVGPSRMTLAVGSEGRWLAPDWAAIGISSGRPWSFHRSSRAFTRIDQPSLSLTYGLSNALRNCAPRRFTATDEHYMAHGSLDDREQNSTGQLWPLHSSLPNLSTSHNHLRGFFLECAGGTVSDKI
jgi:hypothetical protein